MSNLQSVSQSVSQSVFIRNIFYRQTVSTVITGTDCTYQVNLRLFTCTREKLVYSQYRCTSTCTATDNSQYMHHVQTVHTCTSTEYVLTVCI